MRAAEYYEITGYEDSACSTDRANNYSAQPQPSWRSTSLSGTGSFDSMTTVSGSVPTRGSRLHGSTSASSLHVLQTPRSAPAYTEPGFAGLGSPATGAIGGFVLVSAPSAVAGSWPLLPLLHHLPPAAPRAPSSPGRFLVDTQSAPLPRPAAFAAANVAPPLIMAQPGAALPYAVTTQHYQHHLPPNQQWVPGGGPGPTGVPSLPASTVHHRAASAEQVPALASASSTAAAGLGYLVQGIRSVAELDAVLESALNFIIGAGGVTALDEPPGAGEPLSP